MRRALALLLSVGFCVSLAGCPADGKKDSKKEAKKDTTKKADDKDHHEKDEKDHKHAKSDKKDEHDPHAPSKTPLVIVDDIVAASDHVTQLFANDHARVLDIELHQGEDLPLHKGGSRVVYALTDLKLKFTDLHGDHTHSDDASFSAGQVHAHGPGTHAIANLADADARLVVFLRKDSDAFTASVPADAQTITDATKFAKSVFGNDDFRVIKVVLPSGEKVGEHFALNRLIYALDDGQLTFSVDGNSDALELKTGEVHYHAAGSGRLENSGESIAKFLIVELKR